MKINLITLLSLLFSFTCTVVNAENVRRGQATSLQQRQLQGDGMRDFVPLSCNANLASATCSTWSSAFGPSNSHTSQITIPCGQCITMDHAPGGSLELLGGLDVIGKLVFPDGYTLNLSSTKIVVQGELQMTSSKAVDGIPAIRFTMIGSDNTLTFTPVDVNANACKGVSTCSIGKKAIIVAGGKITGTSCYYNIFDTDSGSLHRKMELTHRYFTIQCAVFLPVHQHGLDCMTYPVERSIIQPHCSFPTLCKENGCQARKSS